MGFVGNIIYAEREGFEPTHDSVILWRAHLSSSMENNGWFISVKMGFVGNIIYAEREGVGTYT